MLRVQRRSLIVVPCLAALAAAATSIDEGGAVPGPPPRCFGAAARDPLHPCRNQHLATLVIPKPGRALKLPNAPCVIARLSYPFVCRFGAPVDRSTTAFLLLGDSHATHWRAALGPVAERKGWTGTSMTRAGCPYSFAPPILPPRLLPECLRWRRAVLAWFRVHPEVSTVFVSGHPVRVAVPPGADPRAVEIAGYRRAWRALPRTVRHIVVLRDTPVDDGRVTRACIARAMARHAVVGEVCAVPRGIALRHDAEVDAARGGHDPRLGVVDLTRYMCDATSCFPVVGGALVHKDGNHLTAIFGATLAPYLRRALDRLGVP